MRGNRPVRFGEGPTEKDCFGSTSLAVYSTLRGTALTTVPSYSTNVWLLTILVIEHYWKQGSQVFCTT